MWSKIKFWTEVINIIEYNKRRFKSCMYNLSALLREIRKKMWNAIIKVVLVWTFRDLFLNADF